MMYQVRKIKPTRRSVSGKLLCKGKLIQYESTLERDFLIIHHFNPYVHSITAQPLSIKFRKNGREYSYTPDFYIKFKNTTSYKDMIIEVKPESLWRENWREWSDKWKSMKKYCHQKNMCFHIYDETRIRTTALENINDILPFKNITVSEIDVVTILKQLNLMGITTVDYILTRFYTGSLLRNHGLRVIYHLLATQRIFFNFFEKLNDQTEIWVFDE